MRRAPLLLLWLAACGDPDDPAGGDDVLDQLAALDGVTVEEVFPERPEAGLRYFDLWFTQPLDHDDPGAGTFQQYAALIHRDPGAPLVLHTSGYGAGWRRFRNEVSSALDANQLSVGYRFFAGSVPAPSADDWALLTVAQGAADFHAVVGAVQPLYPSAWIHTGGSKGGVTALISRQLYPDDVDGVVAYVAPIMTGQPDERFAGVLDGIGDDGCRAALRDAQRAIAARKDAMAARALLEEGDRYELLGVDFATEVSIVELEWSFWQYIGYEQCGAIPGPDASDQVLWEFFAEVAPPAAYSDVEMLDTYQPFVYQAMRELGYPRFEFDHIADLITIDYQDLSAYLAPGLAPPTFDPALSQGVIDWAASDAERVLLIYGAWDPWSGGAIDVDADNDSYRFDVAMGSHWSAGLSTLAPGDQAVAVDALERWTGVAPVVSATAGRRDRRPARGEW